MGLMTQRASYWKRYPNRLRWFKGLANLASTACQLIAMGLQVSRSIPQGLTAESVDIVSRLQVLGGVM